MSSTNSSDEELKVLARLADFNIAMDSLRNAARQYAERTMRDIRDIMQPSGLTEGIAVTASINIVYAGRYRADISVRGTDVLLRIPFLSHDAALGQAKKIIGAR